MKIVKRSIKRHLFVCCNRRDGEDSCATKNPEALVNNIKKRLREADRWDDYKVSKSGCLGPCAFGITATIYPDNILLTQLTIADEDELYGDETETAEVAM